jgi:hypothetical protein
MATKFKGSHDDLGAKIALLGLTGSGSQNGQGMLVFVLN